MEKSRSFKDKLREAFIENDKPGRGWRRLGLIVVFLVAAQAVLRLVLSIMALLGIAFWVSDRPETKNPEQAAEARRLAEETSRIVGEVREKAEATQRAVRIRQQEEIIEQAVHSVAMAMVTRNMDLMDRGGGGDDFTDNLDDLIDYGFQRDPDLIYDIKLLQGISGNPIFTVLVRHRENGPRAFKFDLDSGAGVAPVEP